MNVIGADPIIHHCQVYNNQVLALQRAFGGGVNLDNSSAMIEADSRIYGNTADSQAGDGYGGGVSIGEAMSVVPPTPVIRNSRVTTNTLMAMVGYGAGGGIGFYDESSTWAIIHDSVIYDNQNLSGAPTGISCGGGIGMGPLARADLIEDNLIYTNLALSDGNSSYGGGICLYDGNVVTATNNLVHDNHADDMSTPGVGGGGGIFSGASSARVHNNTLVANATTGYGGGILLAGGTFHNNVVVANTASTGGGMYAPLTGPGPAGFNDVWNNSAPEYGPLVPATDINLDPFFVGSGDLATWYHLRWNSPCIDAGIGPGPGIPPDDFDDQARPLNNLWDIGFDEVYAPIFGISKIASSNPVMGAPLTYTLSVVNSGSGPGMGVLVTDAVPLNAHYVGGGSFAGGIVQWTPPPIPPGGGSVQFGFTVTTCQSTLSNNWYRVATSTFGVDSPWGTPLVVNLAAPTLNASFDSAPHYIAPGDTVHFTDTTTTDGGPIVAWDWDFGDGSTGSGSTTSHAYALTGTYTVTLTVKDVCSFGQASQTVNAVIAGPPCVDLTAITIGGPTSGLTGTYTFTTSYEPVSATKPINYLWANGDTFSTTVRSLDVGTHTLTITASNCNNALVTDTHTIVIEESPPLCFLPIVVKNY
jgi:uncharacterized repeat protein (TIGR01451 family)